MGENGLLKKVKQAITSNATVKGLMADLQDAGIKARNELEAVILAEDYWIKINDIERGPLENYRVSELKELPFTSVRNNGIEYRIHGITHDPPGRKVLSKETRNVYRTAALELSNPHKGEECLYEPGMMDVLSISIRNADEIPVTDILPHYIRTCWNLFSERKRLSAIKKDVESRTENILAGTTIKVADLLEKTRTDPGCLFLFREAYKRQLFPMPLELEKRALKFDIYGAVLGGFQERFKNYFCRPALSKEYAKHLKHFAESKGLKIAHFVAGLAHESEVAYYIQN